jgi:hypothetical protein
VFVSSICIIIKETVITCVGFEQLGWIAHGSLQEKSSNHDGAIERSITAP